MIQPHIKIDKISRTILLPGDPGRIDKILTNLENTKEIQYNREYRISSGTYKDIEIAALSTGMGCPAAAIAIEELANIGAKNLIRIGTCGGLLKEMQPGDIIIPNSAFCGDGTSKEYGFGEKIVQADKKVVQTLIECAKKAGVRYFVGTNRTHDAFYEPIENFIALAGKNFISSEMECSIVFLVSKLRKLSAGAILVVNTPEPPENVKENPDMIYTLVDKTKVEEGMKNAIKIAIEAASILEKQDKL